MFQRLLIGSVLAFIFPVLVHAAAATKREQLLAMRTVLVELDTHYGMLDFKRDDMGITLDGLESKYGRLIEEAKTLEEDLGYTPAVARETLSSDQFQQLMVAMIAELKDGHVNIGRLSQEFYTLGIFTAAIEGRLYVTGFSKDLFIPGRAGRELKVGDEVLTFNGERVQQVAERLRLYSQSGTFEARDNEALESVLIRHRGHYAAVEEGAHVNLTFRRGDETFKGTYRWIATREYRNARSLSPEAFDTTLLKGGSEFVQMPFGFTGMVKSYFRSGLERQELAPGTEWDVGSILNQELVKNAATPEGRAADAAIAAAQGAPTKVQPVSRLTASVVRHEGKNIGILRIPSYSPGSPAAAVNELRWVAEVLRRFENSVDVLVIDQLSNSGGYVFYVGALAQLLAGKDPLRAFTVNMRLNETLINRYADPNVGNDLMTGRRTNWAQNRLAQLHYKEMAERYANGEKWSGPMAMWQPDTDEAAMEDGEVMPHEKVTFTRPILILNDNKSASGGDFFPGLMQGSNRAVVMGETSKGLGGPVYRSIDSMPGSEMSFRCTSGYCQRPDGQPLESLGVIPNVVRPVRARDLREGFRQYSADVLKAAVMLVEGKKISEIQEEFRKGIEQTVVSDDAQGNVEKIKGSLEKFRKKASFKAAEKDLAKGLKAGLAADYAALFAEISELQSTIKPEEARGLVVPVPKTFIANDKFLGALYRRDEFVERLGEMMKIPRWNEDKATAEFISSLHAALASNPGQLWVADPCELLLSPKTERVKDPEKPASPPPKAG